MVKPPSVARCSPRDSSSTSPPASTMVRPSTHSRTVPYLNVAAPAAHVATAPPAKAPRYVGTGGNQRPAFASSSCNACSGTPAPARTRSPVMLIVLRRSVLRTMSPSGVAPPVSDDCAPTASTRRASRRHADTSSIDRGRSTPAALPPG